LEASARHQSREAAAEQGDGDFLADRVARDDLDVRVFEQVREPACGLQVLVVAFGPKPLITLDAVPFA